MERPEPPLQLSRLSVKDARFSIWKEGFDSPESYLLVPSGYPEWLSEHILDYLDAIDSRSLVDLEPTTTF